MTDHLATLAAFAAETTYDDIPAEVIDRAKAVLRDTVGVILGGMGETEVQGLVAYSAQQGGTRATLMGGGETVSPELAALVHGSAGTALEMDEGHAFARGHAAIHAIPPALALAQQHNASGKDLLTAIVVGYEVAARTGVGTQLRTGVHPFGAWGVLGAATVAAKFAGLDAHDMKGTLEVAASYAIAPSFNTATQGANVRNTYAGMVNRLGMQAAAFYQLGVRGEVGGVETAFGRILGEQFNADALTEELGTHYEMLRGYFKPYSGCRYSHATVDALLHLMADADIDADSVESMTIETYATAAKLNDPHPPTPLAGRFSLPHIAAATLVRRDTGPGSFSADSLTDNRIRSLAERVQVSEDTAFTALTPAQRPARVTVTGKDGTQRTAEVMGSKGDPDQPMTSDELRAKFESLAEPVIGAEKAANAWQMIGEIETVADTSTLMTMLHSK